MRRLAILTFALPLTFGSAVVVSRQTPASPSAQIAGRVVDAQSRSPIAGVVVVLTGGLAAATGAGPSTATRVMTDADGRYAFRGLRGGSYQIGATVGGSNNYAPNGFVVTGLGFPIGGYLNGGFGQQRPDGPLQPIDLADGQQFSDAVIRLWKSAAVSGRVLDEAGEGLVGQVIGVVPVSTDGRLLNGPTIRTDDRGAYRLGSLAPGTYIVFVPQTQVSMPVSIGDELAAGQPDPTAGQRFSAANAPAPSLGGVRIGASILSTTPDNARFGSAALISNALAPVREGDALFAYPTTFHPSATTLAQAARITLAPGEELSPVDVILRPVRTVPVSGTLVDDVGPAPQIGLHLMPGDIGDDASILETAMTATDFRGAFTFPAVPAGRYTLIAWRTGGAPGASASPTSVPRLAEQSGAWAMMPVAVGNQRLESLTLTMRAPIVVSGRLEFSGTSPRPPVARLRSAFTTIWQTKPLFRTPGPSPGGTPDPETLRLTVHNVSPPGRYFVGAANPGAPWTLESITVGGREVLDAAFAVQGDHIDDLVITYTDRPATLAGVVERPSGPGSPERMREGGPDDPGASVMLFPASRTRWIDARLSSRTFRIARPSTTGMFSWTAVPPGDYLVIAVRDADAGSWPDELFLARLAAVATPVRLAPAQSASVTLQVRTLR